MKRIDGVKVKELKVIPDARGRLMEILRADDPEFIKFGQVYMTTAYPGVVKAWHYHEKQTDHFCVVSGMLKLVLFDRRDGSPTKGEINEFFIGEHHPARIAVPPLVLHGFMGIGVREAVVINCVTEVYNYNRPDEFRLPPHGGDVPYDWKTIDR